MLFKTNYCAQAGAIVLSNGLFLYRTMSIRSRGIILIILMLIIILELFQLDKQWNPIEINRLISLHLGIRQNNASLNEQFSRIELQNIPLDIRYSGEKKIELLRVSRVYFKLQFMEWTAICITYNRIIEVSFSGDQTFFLH